jgi:peptidoglycan/xylan/chitin deacetylase (PgdA/CDA1 family)
MMFAMRFWTGVLVTVVTWQALAAPHDARGAEKCLYLTFDDGPLAGTDDCLAVCKAKQVVATFFMVGAHVTTDFRKQQVKDARAFGMSLANHSFSHWHDASNYADNGKTNAQWQADFKSCSDKLAEVLAMPKETFLLARLPGKNAWRVDSVSKDDGNSKRVADHLSLQGYKIYGWDVEWQYTGEPAASDPKQTPEEMVTKVVAALGVNRKAILLMHDHQFRTSRGNNAKLEMFIDKLKAADGTIKFRSVETYSQD